jgi:hypothetical protein
MPRRATKADAFEMFCFASLYHQGASLLYHAELTPPLNFNNRTLSGMFVPRSVLLSFSFELYLKCLKRVRGKSPLTGHDTRTLFSDLSPRDRRLIKLKFVEIRESLLKNTTPLLLDNVIERTRNYFPQMRYGYEQPSPRLPSGPDIIGIGGLDDAAEAVRQVVLLRHADWHQRYLDRENFL